MRQEHLASRLGIPTTQLPEVNERVCGILAEWVVKTVQLDPKGFANADGP